MKIKIHLYIGIFYLALAISALLMGLWAAVYHNRFDEGAYHVLIYMLLSRFGEEALETYKNKRWGDIVDRRNSDDEVAL